MGAHRAGNVGDFLLNFFEDQLVCFGVPVGDEYRVELFDDGTGAREGEVFPLQTFTHVFFEVVGAVDGVLRARECHCAVDHEDFTVVAQVGALPLQPPGFDGQHQAPFDTRFVEHFCQLPV